MESEFLANTFKHAVGEIIDVNGDGSVMKEVLIAGTGSENPPGGVEVVVNYVGRLFDTKVQFDANDGFKFTSDEGVIQGWQDVIRTMVIGEKSRVVIQADKGYGAEGAGADIPPHATLEFDIELTAFKSEKDLNEDGAVLYKTLKSTPGEWLKPENLAVCSVAVIVRLAETGEEILKEEVSALTIDDDAEVNLRLPVVVEDLLKVMTRGQVVSARVRHTEGFDKASPHFGKDLEVLVSLRDFTASPKFWELSPEQKVAEGERLKSLGNVAFKKGSVDALARACRRYQEAITGLEYVASDAQVPGEYKRAAAEVVKSCRMNASTAHVKIGEPKKALEYAAAAVEMDTNAAKAWFRLGSAHAALKDWREAERAFSRARDLEPKDAGILAELKKAKEQVKKESELEKKKFKGMFSKLKGFASDDRKVSARDEEVFSDMDEDDIPDLIPGDEDEEVLEVTQA